MRIIVNGVYRDETPEEIDARVALEQKWEQSRQERTPEQRIADLEAELKATKILLGLEA